MECNLLYDNNVKLYLSDSDILKHSYKNTTYKNLSKMFIKYTVNKEKENTFTSTADCKLAQQCMDPDEKYYEIHGFNRSEPAVDPKCKC